MGKPDAIKKIFTKTESYLCTIVKSCKWNSFLKVNYLKWYWDTLYFRYCHLFKNWCKQTVFIESYFKSFKLSVKIFIVHVVAMIDLRKTILLKWGTFVIASESFIKRSSDSCCFPCIGWTFIGIIIIIKCTLKVETDSTAISNYKVTSWN